VNDEVMIQRNAQIHGLLMANLSNETFTKYCYLVENGDGAQLWKLLCESNEMYTKKLQMSLRKEILNEKIEENAQNPWSALSQFLDRLIGNFSRLKLISSDHVQDQDMLAIVENQITVHDVYKDLRSWLNIAEPSTFQEAVIHIRKEILDQKIKVDCKSNKGDMKFNSKEEKTPIGPSEEEKYHYVNARSWSRGRGRGGFGHGGQRGQDDDIGFRNGQRGGYGRYGGGSNSTSSRGPLKCFNCGGMNHKRRECPSPPAQQQRPSQQMQAEKHTSDILSGDILSVEECEYVNVVDREKYTKEKPRETCLDSAASNHTFGNDELMRGITSMKYPICAVVATGEKVEIDKVGEVQMQGCHNSTITITHVRYCPAFTKNLLSVAQLVDRGLEVVFNQNEAVVRRGNQILMKAHRQHNMFVLSNEIIAEAGSEKERGDKAEPAFINTDHITESDVLWHHRLGHCDMSKVKMMRANNIIDGMRENTKKDHQYHQRIDCHGCGMGKSTRNPFDNDSSRIPADHPLMRIFHDNSGNINVPDQENPSIKKLTTVLRTEKYLSLIVDDYSGYIMGKPIYHKNESVDHLIDTILLEETQTGYRVQIVNADDSGEIRTARLLDFFQQKGIKRNLTNKETPQHNAVVERAMRTVFEATRTLLFHANLHAAFWGYAVLAAIVALNYMPTHRDKFTSRMELFRSIKPSAQRLRVFGCDVVVHILKSDRSSKVEQTALNCIFIGYDEHRENGYLFFDPSSMTVITSRDALFNEYKFTCGRHVFSNTHKDTKLELQHADQKALSESLRSLVPIMEKPYQVGSSYSIDKSQQNSSEKPLQSGNLVGHDEESKDVEPQHTQLNMAIPTNPLSLSVPLQQIPNQDQQHEDTYPVHNNEYEARSNNDGLDKRSSTRQRNRPQYLHDMIPSNLLLFYTNEEDLDKAELYFLVEDGPSNFTEAMKQLDANEWVTACKTELLEHSKNN